MKKERKRILLELTLLYYREGSIEEAWDEIPNIEQVEDPRTLEGLIGNFARAFELATIEEVEIKLDELKHLYENPLEILTLKWDIKV